MPQSEDKFQFSSVSAWYVVCILICEKV
jgi:hypothetical protein